MLIDQPEAFAFPRREQTHGVLGDDVTRDHSASS